MDAYGLVLNDYSGRRRIDEESPEVPWAVYLAGADSRFRLLAFDLDAKNDPERAARDADTLAGFLDAAGIQHIVCVSGPSGGRHVWAALADSIDAATVATLARLLRHLCPSLDLAPLTNPVTGCVRPPGAPHRAGGCSTVLRGDVDTLTNPTATAANVRALVESVARLVDQTEPPQTIDPHTPLPVDDHGRLHLTGRRRELPAVSAAALRQPAAEADASAVLWRVLIGAAAARWRHQDVAALVPTSPGLEHVRTSATPAGRQTRPTYGRGGQAAVLARQWDKAVRYVAAANRQVGEDPTFDPRADAIATHVRTIQARADVSGGRWTQGGGPADRRVLDALCSLALQALTPALEADTRRLALMTGIGRETARTALVRLSADGWIAQERAADGPHGAHWTIDPQKTIHKDTSLARSQADPRPAGAGSAERVSLLSTLTTRLRLASHDLFSAGPGLGHLVGNLYSRIDSGSETLDQLSSGCGVTRTVARRVLLRLERAGVIVRRPTGWQRTPHDARSTAAENLGTSGRLADRARRYRLERELWAWWQAEEAWMCAPRRTHHSRRAGPGQLSLLPEEGTNVFGAYPRRADGRADHRAARVQLRTDAGAPRSLQPDSWAQGPRQATTHVA